ncbi:translation initiation factor IF-2 [Streptomyces sp. SID11385]|uniref:translation initiation factor IF-2 n=1 Tax=Streptomyces sp. SID11385 TaxID=2706031 RepID=UPI0013C78218|nr:translation initiation factor IF-2 [Streptomyces sp. SID11385]NEA43293.1 translation initiation factor IF-2 [Streptomyces sp. SID11385]
MTAILPDKATPTGSGDRTATSFLPAGARERLEPKLREAVSEFVDSPAEAVEKADRLLAETVEQLHKALVHRHGELRSAWDGKGGAGSARSAGARSAESARGARREDGAGLGDRAGFGDGTPGGAGTAPGADRAEDEPTGLDGRRDRTGTTRDADGDGVADDRTGLPGTPSAAWKPGATTEDPTGAATGTTTGVETDATTDAGARVPGDEKTASRPGNGTEADTERLRLALQEYRETTERLLNL